MKLYSFYDSQIGIYAPPFVARNDADAIRSLIQFAKEQPKAQPITYANEFFLTSLGDWSDDAGITALCTPVRTLGSVASLLGAYLEQPTEIPTNIHKPIHEV